MDCKSTVYTFRWYNKKYNKPKRQHNFFLFFYVYMHFYVAVEIGSMLVMCVCVKKKDISVCLTDFTRQQICVVLTIYSCCSSASHSDGCKKIHLKRNTKKKHCFLLNFSSESEIMCFYAQKLHWCNAILFLLCLFIYIHSQVFFSRQKKKKEK